MKIGNYEVLEHLSEGGFGITYRGRHIALDVPVCIKQEKTGVPEYQALFRNEARLLFDIRHVSLPTLKDYLEFPDHGQVMIMSFIEGVSVEEVLRTQGPIDDEHILWITQRLLDAMSYLHYHGIIHCDTKPANVILDTPEHNATLVDFGLCLVNPDGATRALGGTEGYLPPEFADGLPPLPASDIYSLGKTMIRMAGGNHESGVTPSDMDPRLAALIGQMIRRDPLQRPHDARALNQEVSQLRRAIYGRSSTREEFKLRHQ